MEEFSASSPAGIVNDGVDDCGVLSRSLAGFADPSGRKQLDLAHARREGLGVAVDDGVRWVPGRNSGLKKLRKPRSTGRRNG